MNIMRMTAANNVTNNDTNLTRPTNTLPIQVLSGISGTSSAIVGVLKGTPLPVRVACLAIATISAMQLNHVKKS
ncbi:MAG: hypothetical protein SP4CHLAM5_07390 [Chlamydiia bacterium]|nr:hypothetical protein [Chlamydiia bacterium]MCH9618606.1 hypothetical protein [Chlamydiia bacterium]MCH9624326.1 hypothetical protein [Chlamydiia bacterium]